MTEFDAVFYDGRTSARNVVRVRAVGGSLHIAGDTISAVVPLAGATVDSPVEGVARAIHLPDGARLQTEDSAAIAALFPRANRLESWVHSLERHWRSTVAGLVVVVVTSAWGVIYGIPLGAELVARRMPPQLESRLGDQALRAVDATLCTPTHHDAARQQALHAAFDRLMVGLDDGARYRLELRACNEMGANAFALPGGAIVLTDALVDLAENDEQIAAVLAHEIGHVRYHHGLRRALQAAGVAALTSALGGDASSIAGLAVTLPTVLLNGGYSRDFEEEADSYAFQRLTEVGLSPEYFAQIMARLEKSRGEGMGTNASGGRSSDYLSTHPTAARRIERARSNP